MYKIIRSLIWQVTWAKKEKTIRPCLNGIRVGARLFQKKMMPILVFKSLCYPNYILVRNYFLILLPRRIFLCRISRRLNIIKSRPHLFLDNLQLHLKNNKISVKFFLSGLYNHQLLDFFLKLKCFFLF